MKYILTQEKYVYNKKLGIEPTNEIFGLLKKLFSKVSNAIKNVEGGEELNKAITDTKVQIDTLFTKQLQTKTNIKAQGNNQPAKPATNSTNKTETEPTSTQPKIDITTKETNTEEKVGEKTSDNISLDYKINEADAPALDYSTLSIEELKQLEKIIDGQLKNITDRFIIQMNQLKKRYNGAQKTIDAADLAISTIQEYIFDKKYDMFAKSSDKTKIAEIQKKRAEAEKKVKDLTFKISSEANATSNFVPVVDKEYNYLNSENKIIKVKVISIDEKTKKAKVNGGKSEFEVSFDALTDTTLNKEKDTVKNVVSSTDKNTNQAAPQTTPATEVEPTKK